MKNTKFNQNLFGSFDEICKETDVLTYLLTYLIYFMVQDIL